MIYFLVVNKYAYSNTFNKPMSVPTTGCYLAAPERCLQRENAETKNKIQNIHMLAPTLGGLMVKTLVSLLS